MQEECPDLLFLRITTKEAQLLSSKATYVSECQDRDLPVLPEIADQLPTIPGRYDVTELNVAGICLGDATVAAILPLIKQNIAKLRSLSIRSCNLTDGVIHVFNALEGTTQLDFIDCACNFHLNPDTGNVILDFLRRHPRVHRVGLQKTNIGRERIKKITDQLGANRRIHPAPPPEPPFALSRREFQDCIAHFERLLTLTTGTITLETFRDEMPTCYYRLVRVAAADHPLNDVNFITFLQALHPTISRAKLLRCVERYSHYSFVVPVVRRKKVSVLRADDKKDIVTMFQALDHDQDGVISREDLCRSLPESCGPNIEYVLKSLNTEKISKKEFAHSIAAPYLQEVRRKRRFV